MQRTRRTIKTSEVEEHLRTLNKTHVTPTLDIASDKCNGKSVVTNAKPLSTFDIQSDASCVICRKSMNSDCHDKCVAKAIISRLRNPKNRNTSRPTNHSKSVLGKPPSLDSKATIAITVAPASPPKNVVPPSAFTKTKANSSYRWQKWIYNTLGFKWMPKVIDVCMSFH